MCYFLRILLKYYFFLPRGSNIGWKSNAGYLVQAFKSPRDRQNHSLKNEMAQVLLLRLSLFCFYLFCLYILDSCFRQIGSCPFLLYIVLILCFYIASKQKRTKHSKEAKFMKMWTRKTLSITRKIKEHKL